MIRFDLEMAEEELRFCDSYQRMGTLLSLRRKMSVPHWWQLLGGLWSVCDNVGHYKHRLRQILIKANPTNRRAMMDGAELQALAALPDEITIYRGCYDNNRDGLSWSLSPTIAKEFPHFRRYYQKDKPAVLLTGRVQKSLAILHFSREEQEVICPTVQVTHETPIPTWSVF